MLFRKSIPCYYVAVAILSATVLAAQSVQPRREPDVPYVPTTEAAVTAMLKLADVKTTDVVYNLGCGDGRIVVAAAKTFGARGVGVDINPVRISEAKENAEVRVSLCACGRPNTFSCVRSGPCARLRTWVCGLGGV